MASAYTIVYTAHNTYDTLAKGALWQFMILPETNTTQQLVRWKMESNLAIKQHMSLNGLRFNSLQVQTKDNFKRADFEVSFLVLKKAINPFDFVLNNDIALDYQELEDLGFKAQNEIYLRKTKYTYLPEPFVSIFIFDRSRSIFENLQELNHWVYIHLYFKVGVTNIDTPLQDIIEKRHGVCQDFTHLFVAIARHYDIPARYVSGYLHQGNGYFGDSQMHAWAEAYVPNGGWIGFDPTNDILVADNHIKVCHGIDYADCSPLKGVVYTTGRNTTSHSVEFRMSQQ
ncbi:MAG: transglutaminase family protein [Bacteroidota bacterium]